MVLDRPGRYVLGHDLAGTRGKAGIRIDADVFLDLGGFAVEGAAGTLDGIVVGAGRRAVVSNGSIRRWSGSGVNAGSAAWCEVRDVEISHNGRAGLVMGEEGEIATCRLSANGKG
jgi:hypothetical protein